MIKSSNPTARSQRIVRSLAIATALLFTATACSGDDDPDVAPTVDATQASEALEAGLEAHAAGDLTTASAEYERVLTFDATNKFAFFNLALIDEAHANYGLAEDNYRAALVTDPAYEPALFNLAILRTAADPLEAITLYESAVAADPEDAAAWLNLGLLLRGEERVAEGDEAVLRAISLNPELTDPAAAVVSDDVPDAEPTTTP